MALQSTEVPIQLFFNCRNKVTEGGKNGPEKVSCDWVGDHQFLLLPIADLCTAVSEIK